MNVETLTKRPIIKIKAITKLIRTTLTSIAFPKLTLLLVNVLMNIMKQHTITILDKKNVTKNIIIGITILTGLINNSIFFYNYHRLIIRDLSQLER